MPGMFDFSESLRNSHIVLAFSGTLDEHVIDGLCKQIETIEHSQRNKKIIQVMIECFQNILHHSAEKESDSLFVVKKEKNDSLKLITGNRISSSKVDALRARIDEVNTLSGEELKTHYREKLKTTTLSEKGGAGLGLIEIARKSGNKLEYHFEKINEQFSFFTLTVTV